MNFEKLFDDYNVDYNNRVNKGWTNVHCPYCTEVSGTFHGGFNNAGNYYHCWKCGGHDFKETLSLVTNVPKNDIDDLIQQYSGRSILLNKLNKRQSKALKLELPNEGFTPGERKYLLSRNFSPRFLHEKYGVVGGGIVGRWKNRIIIPVYIDGKLVSWTGRSILKKEKLKELEIPRYKNLSIEESVVNIKECLFNVDNCKKDVAVLVEGSFDVMRLGDDFLCSMGTELTQNQIRTLAQKFKKIFIAFDNEIEAQKKARKFGLQLASIGVDVEVVNIYEDFNKNDGGELNQQEVDIIRKELGLN